MKNKLVTIRLIDLVTMVDEIIESLPMSVMTEEKYPQIVVSFGDPEVLPNGLSKYKTLVGIPK